MKFHPSLNLRIKGETFNYRLFEALTEITNTWSQREAAKRLKISHAVLNRRIRDAEEKLGFKLVETTGAGSGLSPQGMMILEKYQRYLRRLAEPDVPVIGGGPIATGLMDVLARQYGLEVTIYTTDDLNALKMAEMDLVDILVLDDPVHAFMHDLDFIPIARDDLVLVSGSDEYLENVDQLHGRKFVEVIHSAQRLAWNTLDQLRVDYEITELCSSPQNALKLIKTREGLLTFQSRSFMSPLSDSFTVSDIMADDTSHIISMVLLNNELEDFSNFIQGRGQKLVQEWGFGRID
ncbi:LysR family transcriptional regulator [Methanobacterium sp.]|uniref:LysR family transcriptional regulator n=1 Tax=Methanobacterium sp. TaxID=2164 RepID=UPI002ABCDE0E|nr:LysR family transcriptional regulator [Methanobacterium sp.]MDY9924233.1 LysR family transcriptional regulator [Methanobacterium sp.]